MPKVKQHKGSLLIGASLFLFAWLFTSCSTPPTEATHVLLFEQQTEQTRQIYKVNPNGSQIELIIEFPRNSLYWLSPQGNRLAVLVLQTTQLPGPTTGSLIIYDTTTGQMIETVERVGQTTSEHFSLHENVVWSPDGDKLLFLRSSQDNTAVNIFLYDVETREVRALTSDNSINLAPAWSPLGDKIAYVKHKACFVNVWDCPPEQQFWEIFITDLDNSFPYTITNFQDGKIIPPNNLWFTSLCNLNWSPDGNHIVFENNCGELLGIKYFKEVFIADISRSSAKQLTQFMHYDAEAIRFPDVAFTYTTQWSPSGGKVWIGYSKIEVTPNGKLHGGIDGWIIDNDEIRVANLYYTENMRGSTVRWSPDGQLVTWCTELIDEDRIIYQSPIFLGQLVNNQLAILDFSESLPYGSCDNQTIQWSPDGNYVAYISETQKGTVDEEGTSTVVIVSVFDREVRKVANVGDENLKVIGWSVLRQK